MEETRAKRSKLLLVKKNVTAQTVDVPVPDGVYLEYPESGMVVYLAKRVSVYGDLEYSYSGELPDGKVRLVSVKDGIPHFIPTYDGWNHGYTLEGVGRAYFHAAEAITRYEPSEDRSFVYVNPQSELSFVGGMGKKFELSVRFFKEAAYGPVRWAVINLLENFDEGI